MRLARRVGRLETPSDGRLPTWARALAAEVAVAEGADYDALLAEAERWLGRR